MGKAVLHNNINAMIRSETQPKVFRKSNKSLMRILA